MYGIEIIIQWIPGHSDIKMNEKADGLAKKGITHAARKYLDHL